MTKRKPPQVCAACGYTTRGGRQYERDHLCVRCRRALTCVACHTVGTTNLCHACRQMLRNGERLISGGCHAPQPGQEERIARYQERAEHQLPLSE